MTNTLKEMLENGATRQLTISFPDDQDLPDLTEEVQGGSVSFSRVLSSGDDLQFSANPLQMQFVANGVPDVAGKRIRATWTVAYETEEEATVETVPLFDGYVETADIQPNRASRRITAYDVLQKAKDVKPNFRSLFSPTIKTEYKGTYDPTSTYSYGDVVLYDGVHYKWLVKETDKIMVGDVPTTASTVLAGKTFDQILASFSTYVQELSEYDEYQYSNALISSLVRTASQAIGAGSTIGNTIGTPNYSSRIPYSKKIEEATASELLNYVAQLAGRFICVNPSNGRLTFYVLGSETVDFSNNYEALNTKWSEYATPAIGKIELINEAGVIVGTYGNGATAYQVRNALTYGIATNANAMARALYNELNGRSYVPSEISSIVSFPLKPGARITLTTPNGETLTTYVLEDSMSGTQCVNQRLTAKGKKTRESETYEPLQDYLNRRQAEETARAEEEARRAGAEIWNSEARSSDRIGEKAGLYTTKVRAQGGDGWVFYLHDQPDLLDSEIRIEISAESIRFSQDGGSTWTTELKIDGETITQILTAIGVNAEWINAGTLTAMTLQGTRGEIGNWTIRDYALMSEFISAVQNIGYKVVLRAPAEALYERDGVSTDNGTVEVDEETGQIRVTPETSGACAITIKTNRIIGYDDYRLTWTTNYSTGNMGIALAVQYRWDDGSAYRVNWSASNRSASGTYRFYLAESTKQRVEGSSYGYGTLTFTLPSAVAGTEYRLDLSMQIDGEDVRTWIDDGLPDGFSHDVVLGIRDENENEIATAIYGDGRVFMREATVRKLQTEFEDSRDRRMEVDSDGANLKFGFPLRFYDEFEDWFIYTESIHQTGGEWKDRLIIEPSFVEETTVGEVKELSLRGFVAIAFGMLANFVKMKTGEIKTIEDGYGNRIRLTEDSELFFENVRTPGGSVKIPTRIKFDENSDGDPAMVVDGGTSSQGTKIRIVGDVEVEGTLRETESDYTTSSVGTVYRSGNLCMCTFDLNAGSTTSEQFVGQIADTRFYPDFEVQGVAQAYGNGADDTFAYVRLDSSGRLYAKIVVPSSAVYHPNHISGTLTWLCR